ncbi:transporter [Corynebacterium testudinoris]|uniref:Putative permease n=1 Tax=Corynebacterium testudinoris TaxID=136857 RepID=A0A0G3H7D4_9CORY|nr:aspartate:alanine exchanger family transporter [Corynebacterium testudinoris]AKK09264.1 putative permease [Corynebacterium testudinoris]MBX8995952.1 transporter [Corynebacterium testudinoris]
MNIFVESPLLALLVIMAVGLLLGRVRIFGFRLGVAAVLFVGLVMAAIEPAIQIPSLIYIVGLSLFVYTIGLESGHDFFANFRSKGLRNNLLAVIAFAVISAATYGLVKLFSLHGVTGTGMFTGALTNTPAMAAVVEALPTIYTDAGELKSVEALPLVAYSLAYPLGVLLVILTIAFLGKLWKVDYDQEALEQGVAVQELYTRRILVRRDDLHAIAELPEDLNLSVIVSRLERDGEQRIPSQSAWAKQGDILSVVGTEEELERAAELLGEALPGDPFHGHDLDYRRIFVSNNDLVGIPLAKLRPQLSGLLITRVRRGDHDMIATPDTILQLGDRVRVVSAHNRMGKVTRLFGDSYRRLSDVNLFPLVAGLAIGVAVGMIAIPIPGGAELKLGSAGGPLVVALILGAIGRTGKIVWQVPYGANLALRQMGITLFLAAIGTTAGAGFRDALSDPVSLSIIAAGGLVTLILSVFVMVVGYKIMKLSFGETAGVLAGIQTQPAVLAYLSDTAKNELPAMGYTSVYPVSMVLKIIAAQVLLILLI